MDKIMSSGFVNNEAIGGTIGGRSRREITRLLTAWLSQRGIA